MHLITTKSLLFGIFLPVAMTNQNNSHAEIVNLPSAQKLVLPPITLPGQGMIKNVLHRFWAG